MRGVSPHKCGMERGSLRIDMIVLSMNFSQWAGVMCLANFFEHLWGTFFPLQAHGQARGEIRNNFKIQEQAEAPLAGRCAETKGNQP